jgi:hypothetical protein
VVGDILREMLERSDFPFPHPVPDYWFLLADSDKQQYSLLKQLFADKSRVPSPLGEGRLEAFESIIETIHHFAERGNDTDWRRFLVCGLCWMGNAIGINTRQLGILLSRCKSSINGSLKQIGYVPHSGQGDSWKAFFFHIPCLRGRIAECRQWTIRYKSPPSVGFPHLRVMRDFAQMEADSPRLQDTSPASPEISRVPVCPVKFRDKFAREMVRGP